MVKIKEGCVMSRFEKQWYERQNALPRKASGTVAYYFKRQTKYPPRIYVFMHAELWCDRNRRPMGLFYEHAFMTRPMNREEIEYHHFDTRLCYHQYEDWDRLLYAEQQEADELDRENPGTGTAFLDKLKSFRSRSVLNGNDLKVYRKAETFELPEEDNGNAEVSPGIAKTEVVKAVGAMEPAWPVPDLCLSQDELLKFLVDEWHRFPAPVISGLLNEERTRQNRKSVLIALTTLYRNFGVEEGKRKKLVAAKVLRWAEVSALRTRRNFVRRVWKRNKLFALPEIQVRYPDYSEAMLKADLTMKKTTVKRKKHKPVTDLRRCQMEKYAARLRHPLTTEKEYHDACCRIVMLQNAHDHRSPIALAVTLQKETKVYTFAWHTREDVVKRFADQANAPNTTHDSLANMISPQLTTNLLK